MSRRLRAYVEVDGTWYAPGSDIPEDVEARIVNPKAWDDGDTTVKTSESKTTSSRSRTAKSN